jgi:hypothetical protein
MGTNMTAKFEIIPFNDHQIMTVRNDSGIHVVMKPIAEALGLDWSAQLQRIKRHPVLAEGMVITTIPSVNGRQDAAALELERFHGWLVTISPDRIADEEKRNVIIDYQRRAFRVIYEHFHGPMSPSEPPYSPVRDLIALQNQAMRLTGRLQRTANAAERRLIHSMLGSICQQVGVETPPLDQLGHDAPTPPDHLRAFWHSVAILTARGHDINHHRVDGMLAINLNQIKALFKKEGIAMDVKRREFTDALRLSTSPRFVKTGAVNSRDGKTVNCWTFQVAEEVALLPA